MIKRLVREIVVDGIPYCLKSDEIIEDSNFWEQWHEMKNRREDSQVLTFETDNGHAAIYANRIIGIRTVCQDVEFPENGAVFTEEESDVDKEELNEI